MTEAATPPAAAAAWAGWYRPSKQRRWTKVCEAATYDNCWGELLAKRPPGSPRAELLVNDGTDPNDAEPAGRGR
jgi:hypothetical protein